MEHRGLQPKGVYTVSKSGIAWNEEDGLDLPNLSGRLNGVLYGFMNHYGLGGRTLLSSENNDVKSVLASIFPESIFTTADYYSELQGNNADYCWDASTAPPVQLREGRFTSCVCNAMLEHVIDPTSVLANLFSVLDSSAYLYLMTVTPSYHYHRFPRDYCRFFHDYFEDMPEHMAKKYKIKVELMELWSRSGVVNVCYRRW